MHASPSKGRVELKLDPGDSCGHGEQLFARVFSVFGQEIRELNLGSSGPYVIDDLDVGSYLVMVLDGDKVRASRLVAVKPGSIVIVVPLVSCSDSFSGVPK
jgi:hypothetical protein